MVKTVTTETELRQKIELQNKQISLLLQSMKQEREERRQKGEQREQMLSLSVSQMESQLLQLQPKKRAKKKNELSSATVSPALTSV